MSDNRIRLIVADIDGCLSRGSTTPIPLHLIERLVWLNNLAREDESVPPITFCTGRPQPYVECLIQATQGYTAALCEGGSVLFEPVQHRILTHPGFGQREERLLEQLKHDCAKELVSDAQRVMFEPGKVTHVTLLVFPPQKPEDLVEHAREIAGRYGDAFEVETTRVCVHILFRHLHKGTGIEWLSRETGVPLEAMAGIGDARTDLPFLRRIKFACAPSNAHDDVRNMSTHPSSACDADAVLEFIDQVLAHNRSPHADAALTPGR